MNFFDKLAKIFLERFHSDFSDFLFFHLEIEPSNDDSSYQLFNKEKLRNAIEKQNSS